MSYFKQNHFVYWLEELCSDCKKTDHPMYNNFINYVKNLDRLKNNSYDLSQQFVYHKTFQIIEKIKLLDKLCKIPKYRIIARKIKLYYFG